MHVGAPVPEGPGPGGTWKELRPTAAYAQAGLRCTSRPTSQVRPRTGSRTSTGFTMALWTAGRAGEGSGDGSPQEVSGEGPELQARDTLRTEV